MATDPVFDDDDINLSPLDSYGERVLRGMPSSRIEGRGSSVRRFFAVPQDSWRRGGFRVAASLGKAAAP